MKKVVRSQVEKIWKEVGPYKKPQDLQVEVEIYKKMLGFFSVGDYGYFVFSPPEMRIEYTHPSIERLLGYEPEVFTLDKFLEGVHPEDITHYLNFEATITEFWKSLPVEKVMKYKTRFDFRIRCKDNQYKRLLQQAVVIQRDEEGAVLRTFVHFTDISHLKQRNKMVLSIIGLDGEPSFVDIPPVLKLSPSEELLTKREKEIVQLLARNMSSKAIAEQLHISAETVSTHRKNILRKTEAKSVLHLIQIGLEKGWV